VSTQRASYALLHEHLRKENHLTPASLGKGVCATLGQMILDVRFPLGRTP